MEQIQQIPLDCIFANPQVRKEFDEAGLASLAGSMDTVGQLQPIRVVASGDKFAIVAGERRFRAAELAKQSTIAAIVEGKKLGAGDVLGRQLIENLQREDLPPMDLANGLHELMQLNRWNAAQVAKFVGLSPATVTRALALRTLSEELQDAVQAGTIAPSSAYELTRIEDEAQRNEAATELLSGRLTRDGLAGRQRAERKKQPGDTPSSTSRVTALLGNGRSVTVAAQGLTLDSFITTLEELLSRARRARPQGLGLPTFAKMLKDQSQSKAPANIAEVLT